MPVGPGIDFLRELKKAVTHTVAAADRAACSTSRPIPTAQVVDLDFYGEWSSISAASRGIYLLSDLAYAEIYFDGKPPPSVLQVPGARDIAVEFSSLSKTYYMAGWRIGFAVGNAAADRARWRGSNPISITAPSRRSRSRRRRRSNGPQDCIAEIRERYQAAPRRADRGPAPGGLGRAGAARLDVRLGAVAVRLIATIGSLAFSKLLLEHANVAVSPGVGFGEYGEGYVRIALVENRPAPAPGDSQHQAIHVRPQFGRRRQARKSDGRAGQGISGGRGEPGG